MVDRNLKQIVFRLGIEKNMLILISLDIINIFLRGYNVEASFDLTQFWLDFFVIKEADLSLQITNKLMPCPSTGFKIFWPL